MAALQALLDEGVADGTFPSAHAVVLRAGEVAFDGTAGDATANTRFDLASVTKVVCTTAGFMSLWADGRVSPLTPLRELVPDCAAANSGVTLGDLLYHRSGLPAFEPFFAPLMRARPWLLDPACAAEDRRSARAELLRSVLRTPLSHPLRSACVYSDVGFILLGEAVSRAAGLPLDELLPRLGAPGLHFRRLSREKPDEPVAATGGTRPREPAPGQETLWAPFPPLQAPAGEVDDDNAWCLDGVSGHAGVFGTAGELAAFGQRILEDWEGAGRLAPQDLWRHALAVDEGTPGSTRAMGFDTALPGGPVGGGVGHLGFTGISLWIDLRRRVVVSLCTNRTLLGRANIRIRSFRPRFHDAVIEA